MSSLLKAISATREEEERAAYEWLQNLSDPRLTEEVLLRIKTVVAAHLPDSFVLQKRAVDLAILHHINQQNKPEDQKPST